MEENSELFLDTTTGNRLDCLSSQLPKPAPVDLVSTMNELERSYLSFNSSEQLVLLCEDIGRWLLRWVGRSEQ